MTDAELTILSLVAESPRYGYEIQQIIDERGLREWLTIGFSSIYYILNRLERQNMVTSELRAEGRGPARKVYQITEAGRGILQTAIADLLRQPRSLGSGFELGLANLKALKPRQVYQVLRYHRVDLQHNLDLVEKAWQRHQQEGTANADHIQALYTHSIAVMRAELEWLTTFLEDWKMRHPGVDQDTPQDNNADPTNAVTRINPRTAHSDPAKMIQRLKRLPRAKEE
ncbi:MAG TPA: PadR family transcriptional regulator [Phototrophicaceae bacterium]|nr:PadR family transcriptional regulator [Phototrophicaceae bacterium]